MSDTNTGNTGNSEPRTLHLNRRRRVFLGVCAGFGDYLGIEPFFIRLAMVVAVFTWLPAALIYFVSYFCMNKDGNSVNELKSAVGNSKVAQHFRSIDYKKRLYKNTENRRIFGVCSGFADYFETSPFFIRLAFIGSLFFGPFAILAYIVAAILMDKNPETQRQSRRHHHSRYFHRHANQPMKEAMQEQFRRVDEHMKRRRRNDFNQPESNSGESKFSKKDFENTIDRFAELEKKLRRLEATITSKKFKLHCELNRMSDEPAS